MTDIDLKPKLDVALVKSKGKHFYDVKDYGLFPGTTGFLSVISKPALIAWSRNEALGSVERALRSRLTQGTAPALGTLTDDWIDEVISEASKRPDKLKDDAADLGTRVHKAIDDLLKGRTRRIDAAIEKPVKVFEDWLAESGIEIVLGDTPVASVEHRYGGSLDFLAMKEGRYILGDLKTSAAAYPEYALQVAAYARAVEETYGIKVAEAMILRLDKKEPYSFEVKRVSSLKDSLEAFLVAKKLSDFLKNSPYEGGR